jgi:adenylate cyclase
MRASGRSELELAQENLRAIESLDGVQAILQLLFRAHMAAATRRLRAARPRASVDTAPLAVGFVDLVGFTPLAQRMSPRELREVVERFEDTAHDVVTARGGRLVKVIGDEVMFIAVDPAVACDIALTLVERFAGDASVKPRGGIAVGDLLVRGGDYYGPIVNLAARVADLAVPAEMLVTQEVAAHGGAGLRFEPAGKRMVKGLDAPVSLLAVERAPITA